MDWTSRVRNAFASASHHPDDGVVEELAQHAKAVYEAARADGCSHDEGDRRVADLLAHWRVDAGALRHRSRHLPAATPPPLVAASRCAGLAGDLRYAARLLRRQPRHALLTVLTMALGIGATTVLFSVTYGVLVKPLPWPNADRVVVLKETRGGSAPRFGDFTNAAYLAWRDGAATVESIAAWSQRVVTLSGAGDPERIRITAATATLFPVLGARPLIGSFFEAKDETSPVWCFRKGCGDSASTLIRRCSGDPWTSTASPTPSSVSCRTRSRTRIGRPAPSFRSRSGRRLGNHLSLFSAIGLLRPGVTPAQAIAEGTARGRLAADTGMTTMAIFGSNGPVAIAAHPCTRR